MALPSETIVMSSWMYDVYANGALGYLQEKWFGFKDDNFTTYFPRNVSSIWFISEQASGISKRRWGVVGIVFDSANRILIEQKKVGLI